MLGVSPGACDPDTVVAALRSALERITRHPESRTPDAEEVRLALHVAAAQLIDPQTRAAMIDLWAAPSAPEQPAPSVAPGSPQRPRSPRSADANLGAFRLACFEVLAHSGGFNARARRRIIALADVFGLSPGDLHRVFVPTATHAPTTSTIPLEPLSRPSAPTALADVSGRRRIALIMLIALIVINVVASLALVRVVWPDKPGPKPVKPASEQAAGAPIAPPASIAPDDESIPHDTRSLLLRLRELRDTQIAGRGEAAIADFLEAHDALAATWPTLEPRDLESVALAYGEIIDTIDAYVRPSVDRVFEHFSGDLVSPEHDSARAAAWVAAAMQRLANDSTLSSPVRDRAVMLLHDASIDVPRDPSLTVRQSLHSGLLYGATVAATAFTQPVPPSDTDEVWRQWVADAATLVRWDTQPNQSIYLDGFERLAGVSPTPSGARAADTQMRAIISAIDWRRADAQARLMLWLTDDSILTPTALTTATSAIVAARSDLAGGAELVATSDAIGPRREALTRRWAEALGLAAPRNGLQDVGLWKNASAALLQTGHTPQTAPQWLTLAVQAARLNAAASLLWRQEVADARTLLVNPDWMPQELPPRVPRVPLSVLTRPADARAASWAVRMLNARRDPNERMTLLQEYRRVDRVQSQTDADVLAEAAFYDTSIQVRQSAQQVIRVFLDDPRIIYAVLESLPSTGRSQDESDTIEGITSRSLPSPRHPQWRHAAAAALVARLFELEGAYRVNEADQAAREIAAAYAVMTTGVGDTSQDPQPDTGRPMVIPSSPNGDVGFLDATDPPHTYAEQFERSLRAEAALIADPTLIIEHDRLQNARRAMIGNDLERFAVAQLSCLELLGIVTTGERASRSANIVATLQSAADARRTARTISEQVAVTEVHINQMWAIRLGVDAP